MDQLTILLLMFRKNKIVERIQFGLVLASEDAIEEMSSSILLRLYGWDN